MAGALVLVLGLIAEHVRARQEPGEVERHFFHDVEPVLPLLVPPDTVEADDDELGSLFTGLELRGDEAVRECASRRRRRGGRRLGTGRLRSGLRAGWVVRRLCVTPTRRF